MGRKDFIASKTRERIVVHLNNGESIVGVLTDVYRDCIVLAHASMLADSVSTPIDGEAIIPRERVSWIQQLPSEA